MQPQDRHTAYQTEAHAVVKVVAHIGYTVEMYQIVFAIIDDRQNAIAHRGWKTAIKLLHMMLFQVVDGFFGLAQIRTGGREIFVGYGIEITDYTISAGEVVGHLMIKFRHIFCTSHIDCRA